MTDIKLKHKLFFYICKKLGYFVTVKKLPGKHYILTKVTGSHD